MIVPIDGAEGDAKIETDSVAVDVEQPAPETVYVIVTMPFATPVTKPVDALTVASVTSLEDQVPPASPPVIVNCISAFAQTEVVPVIVPAFNPEL